MKSKIFIVFCLILNLIDFSSCQCDKNLDCGKCIQNINCSWCSDPGLKNSERCMDTANVALSENCKSISNPRSSINEKQVNEEDSLLKSMEPSNVEVKLRLNEKFKFEVKYNQIQKFAVDIYFLMDNSWSMKEHKSKLADASKDLAKEIDRITPDFNLGFGTFVEKPIFPFTDVYQYKPSETKPYSFKNHMKLSKNAEGFKKIIQETLGIGNNDDPEAGLDGLMQSMVCSDQIGWRNNSRKLIIFFTDSISHIAGDGKLAGIHEPSDELCHLEEDSYSKEIIHDYPSINQINRIAKKNGVHIVFAVTGKVLEFYGHLSKRIYGSSSVELKGGKESNIIDIVKNEYKKIRTSVEFSYSHHNKIGMELKSDCSNDPLKKTIKCDEIGENGSVKFEVELHANSCLDDEKLNLTISAYQGSTTIEVETICSCDCENDKNYTISEFCNNQGYTKCGKCYCKPGFLGEFCTCEAKNEHSIDEQNCIDDRKVKCSDRGICKCGICECNSRSSANPKEKFSGKFCECDDYSCDLNGGQMCSGERHGKCDCGKCKCNEGWTGKSCECPVSVDSCKENIDDDEVCSGHGECECGQCKCDENHWGKYCEKCRDCKGKCSEFESCVLCRIENRKSKESDDDRCSCSKSKLNVTMMSSLKDTESTEFLCHSELDADECNYKFTYTVSELESNFLFNIRAQTKMICAMKKTWADYIWEGTITLLIIAVITLVSWKVLIEYYDRKEYKRFLDEMEQRRNFTDNPLFRGNEVAI